MKARAIIKFGLIVLAVGTARADFSESWGLGGDVSGWTRETLSGTLDAPAIGGNPDGYLRFVAATSATPIVQSQYLYTEAGWFTGDLSRQEVTLQYRGTNLLAAALQIVSGQDENRAVWAYTFSTVATAQWTGATIPLHDQTGWAFVEGNGGRPFPLVMQDVRRLGVYILGQSSLGGDEVGLDNVAITRLGSLLFEEAWATNGQSAGWTAAGDGDAMATNGSLSFVFSDASMPEVRNGRLEVAGDHYIGDLRDVIARFALREKGLSARALVVTSGEGINEAVYTYTLPVGLDGAWNIFRVKFGTTNGWAFSSGNAGLPFDTVMSDVRRMAVETLGLWSVPGDLELALDDWRFYGPDPTYTLTTATSGQGSVTPGGPLNVTRSQSFTLTLAGQLDPVYGTPDFAITQATFRGSSLPFPPGATEFAWNYGPINRGGHVEASFARVAVHGVPVAWLDEVAAQLGAGPIADYVAFADSDHDGDRMETWREYYVHTSPTNVGEVLELTGLSARAAMFQFDWPSVADWAQGGDGVWIPAAEGGNGGSWIHFIFDPPMTPSPLAAEASPLHAGYYGAMNHYELNFDVLATNIDALAVIVQSGAGFNEASYSYTLTPPPDGQWTTQVVTFADASAWEYVSGNEGRPFNDVMSEVTNLMVRAVGFSAAPGGLSFGLDNWILYGAPGGQRVDLRWPSMTGVTYQLRAATNIYESGAVIATDVQATPPVNHHTEWNPVPGMRRYTVEVNFP